MSTNKALEVGAMLSPMLASAVNRLGRPFLESVACPRSRRHVQRGDPSITTWPAHQPKCLACGLSRFIGLQLGEEAYPAMLITEDTLRSYKSAFLQRKALLRAQVYIGKRIRECSTRLDEAFLSSKNMAQEMARLTDIVQDEGLPIEERLHIIQQIETIRPSFDRLEQYREDLALQRTMLMSELLDRHTRVLDKQIEADKGFFERLEQDGLLKENDPLNFFETWNALPLECREGTKLHSRLIDLTASRGLDPNSKEAWHCLARDEASLLLDAMHVEIAQGQLAHALQTAERNQIRLEQQENEFYKARAVGHGILTPSQFACESLRRTKPYIHGVAVAEQDLRIANEKFGPWIAVGALDPDDPEDVQAMRALQPLQNFEAEDSVDRGLMMRLALAAHMKPDVMTWLDGMDCSHVPDSDLDINLHPSLRSVENVEMEDSMSTCERRNYETTRAREWSAWKEHDENRLRFQESRLGPDNAA